MTEAGARWALLTFGDVVHAFTDPQAEHAGRGRVRRARHPPRLRARARLHRRCLRRQAATVALAGNRHDNPVHAPAKAEASMHTLSIPQSVVDRVVAKRGREYCYEDLDPAKTALVVVDMQNAFMLPGVAHALCPMAEKIVPNINRLAEAVRETGGTVIWIKTTFKDDALRELVDLFRDGDAATGRQAHRRAHRRQQGPRALGRRSTCGRTTSSSRRTASAPSSRARRTWPRCCARAASTRCSSPAR